MTTKSTAAIADAAASLRRGSLRAVDLVDQALAAIDEHDGRTNAFISVHADEARAEARTADRELARGVDRGPLHGIPMSLKDLVDAAGVVTTAGSRVLSDRIAPADAPVVTRLREAGAIIIGRTNLHEFALGTTSEDSAFGPVRHPTDATRSAGGSSGGSAVAVALGMGLASIGSDTGGSIRIPAAVCGVVGLKPSAGEVPTEGVIPLSPSFDHVGPLTRSVDDAAVVWAVIAGLRPTPLESVRLNGLTLARLGGYFNAPIAPEVRTAFDETMARLAAAGVEMLAGEIAGAALIPEAYVNTVLPEAAAWHAAYLDARGPLYTPTVRARLTSGRTIPAIAYLAAREVIEATRHAVDAALASADALVLPTLPLLAPPQGAAEIEIDPVTGDRLAVRGAMLKHTQPFNLSGHPAISLPIAVTGLPVGLQIVGPRNGTARLLAIAAACEKILGHA